MLPPKLPGIAEFRGGSLWRRRHAHDAEEWAQGDRDVPELRRHGGGIEREVAQLGICENVREKPRLGWPGIRLIHFVIGNLEPFDLDLEDVAGLAVSTAIGPVNM